MRIVIVEASSRRVPIRSITDGRLSWPGVVVSILLTLTPAGSPLRAQDAPPPDVLADFVLGEVEFRGRVNVELAEIEEKTGLKKGNRSDVFRIMDSAQEIRKLYGRRGYEAAQVKLVEGSRPGETKVIIEITEGPKTEIPDLNLAPNPPPALDPASALDSSEKFRTYFFGTGAFPVKQSFGVNPSISEGHIPPFQSEPAPVIAAGFNVDGNSPPVLVGELGWDEARRHVKLAEEAKRAGNKRKALEEATMAIRSTPDLADGYSYRAEIYQSMRLLGRGIAELNEAIRLDPNQRTYYLNRGYDYFLERDPQRGFADFEKAFALATTDENKASVHHWRGIALEFLGESAAAVADLDQAIKLGRKTFEIFRDRGRALARMGEHDLAIVDYDRAAEIQCSAWIWDLRAESYFAKGQLALALADSERAVAAEPSIGQYHQGRGWVLLAQGRVDEAIEDFTRAIEGNPEDRKKSWKFGRIAPPGYQRQDHRAYTGRGWAYLAKHDFQQAITDFEMGIDLKSQGYFYFGLGWAADLCSNPLYERTGIEFDRRRSLEPNLRCALVVLDEQEARSQYLENPYFVVDLVLRTHESPEVGPNLVFRAVADWRNSAEARSAYFGRAIAAAWCSQWQDAGHYLDCALDCLVELESPGSTRPALSKFLGFD